MNDTPELESGKPLPSEANDLRRRLVTGGAAGTAVLLALSSRSALATTCQSPSDKLSGNTSPGHNEGKQCTLGRSPGYWGQPQWFGEWMVDPPTLEKYSGSSWVTDTVGPPALGKFSYSFPPSTPPANQKPPQGAERIGPYPSFASPDFGAAFVSVFTDPGFKRVIPNPVNGNGPTQPPNQGRPIAMWEIVAYPEDVDNGTTLAQLARHCIAAYLNALKAPATYPVKVDQIIAMWQAGSSGMGYCPIPGCSDPWSKEEIITYLSSTFI